MSMLKDFKDAKKTQLSDADQKLFDLAVQYGIADFVNMMFNSKSSYSERQGMYKDTTVEILDYLNEKRKGNK